MPPGSAATRPANDCSSTFYGQGANAAMEDCIEIVRYLDEAGGNWTTALAEYQKRRKPNADAIADYALQNFVEMRDTVNSKAFQAKPPCSTRWNGGVARVCRWRSR